LLCRDCSPLLNPVQSATTPIDSLPGHVTPPRPHLPALYGRPTMQTTDYHSLVSSVLSLQTATHLIWSYIRVIRACSDIDKTTVKKVKSSTCTYLTCTCMHDINVHTKLAIERQSGNGNGRYARKFISFTISFCW